MVKRSENLNGKKEAKRFSKIEKVGNPDVQNSEKLDARK